MNSVACASYFLVCIHFACNFGETILGGAYNATKIKIFKSLIKKGNYVKNPAPDDDPQKLANDSPISEEQTDRIGETGSVLTTHKDCVLHCLTIIGQIEGHYILSQQNKTTKYEHVIPLLVSVEEDERIDGLLVLINTVGGDVEAGLAIAEVISGMKSRPFPSYSAEVIQ